jgi:cardiolipin synthase C
MRYSRDPAHPRVDPPCRIRLRCFQYSSLLLWLVLLAAPSQLFAAGKQRVTLIRQDELGAIILQRISQATRRIYIAQHIMGSGEYGKAITAKLMEAARRRRADGSRLDIRLIYDGLVSSLYAVQAPARLLVSAGVKVQSYNPKERLFSLYRRMHGKLMIVDDEVFVGSSNSHACSTLTMVCVESDAIIEGDAVLRQALHSFQEFWDHDVTWEITFPEPVWDPQALREFNHAESAARYREQVDSYLQQYLPVANRLIETVFSAPEANGSSFSRQYLVSGIEYLADAPVKQRNGGIFSELLERIAAATKSVKIITPYFFPTARIRQALATARGRGARVEVYTTRREELVNIFGLALTRSFEFVHAQGIDLYEYLPVKLLHSKIVVIDERIAYLGSANFDSLSQRFNTENGVLIDLQQGGGISDYFDALIAEIRANSSKVEESSGPGMFDYRQCSRTTCNPLVKLLNPATEFFY